MTVKTFLFVGRTPRRDADRREESLDLVLTAAAFGQEVHVALLDDGVFRLLDGSLDGLTDIEQLWVERPSLAERGLASDELPASIRLVERAEMAALMAGMDVVIPL